VNILIKVLKTFYHFIILHYQYAIILFIIGLLIIAGILYIHRYKSIAYKLYILFSVSCLIFILSYNIIKNYDFYRVTGDTRGYLEYDIQLTQRPPGYHIFTYIVTLGQFPKSFGEVSDVLVSKGRHYREKVESNISDKISSDRELLFRISNAQTILLSLAIITFTFVASKFIPLWICFLTFAYILITHLHIYSQWIISECLLIACILFQGAVILIYCINKKIRYLVCVIMIGGYCYLIKPVMILSIFLPLLLYIFINYQEYINQNTAHYKFLISRLKYFIISELSYKKVSVYIMLILLSISMLSFTIIENILYPNKYNQYWLKEFPIQYRALYLVDANDLQLLKNKADIYFYTSLIKLRDKYINEEIDNYSQMKQVSRFLYLANYVYFPAKRQAINDTSEQYKINYTIPDETCWIILKEHWRDVIQLFMSTFGALLNFYAWPKLSMFPIPGFNLFFFCLVLQYIRKKYAQWPLVAVYFTFNTIYIMSCIIMSVPDPRYTYVIEPIIFILFFIMIKDIFLKYITKLLSYIYIICEKIKVLKYLIIK
jgi:hypothetical protein